MTGKSTGKSSKSGMARAVAQMSRGYSAAPSKR
jgi:hypothetical protein